MKASNSLLTVPAVLAAWLSVPSLLPAGPYTETGINGYVGPDWKHADPASDSARINPIFCGWAVDATEYLPADVDWSDDWNDPNKALGPVTGDHFDIVSLGELDSLELEDGLAPGRITLLFAEACPIRNAEGYDFAVFENGFMSHFDTAGGSLNGQMLAELGYVEVSSNGRDFARFPSVCLVRQCPGSYGTLDVSEVYNLAGKHPNGYGVCTGTPFDLDDLAGHACVVGGLVDLSDIRYVRIIDIPGRGDFRDSASFFTDWLTWPDWGPYHDDLPVYDAWPTWGSAGFDLEAVGVLKPQKCKADANIDGRVDGADMKILAAAWLRSFGQDGWSQRCDLSEPRLKIDLYDFAVLADEWGKVEDWRLE